MRPALQRIGAWSPAAEELVLGTGLQESGFRYLQQISGPAVGLFQMEPATVRDLWDYMTARDRTTVIKELVVPGEDLVEQLRWNHLYAAALCRMFYLRIPDALPEAGNVAAQARYWKRFYNTTLGKGTELAYRRNWARHT